MAPGRTCKQCSHRAFLVQHPESCSVQVQADSTGSSIHAFCSLRKQHHATFHTGLYAVSLDKHGQRCFSPKHHPSTTSLFSHVSTTTITNHVWCLRGPRQTACRPPTLEAHRLHWLKLQLPVCQLLEPTQSAISPRDIIYLRAEH